MLRLRGILGIPHALETDGSLSTSVNFPYAHGAPGDLSQSGLAGFAGGRLAVAGHAAVSSVLLPTGVGWITAHGRG